VIGRRSGKGWLALLGGGEFSFGDTEECDRAWLAKTGDGSIGFVPTASGSADYGRNFTAYLNEVFDREAEVIPLYRARDARRTRNAERMNAAAALYLGAGLVDDLLETLAGTPAAEAMVGCLRGGGTIVAIGAAAHAFGLAARNLDGRSVLPALDWLSGGVVETNFDPAHDRRLRELLAHPGVAWGLGIPAGSAALLGPAGEFETVGAAFTLVDAEADFKIVGLAEPA